MVTAEDLRFVKASTYRMEVAVALLAMAAGLPAGKALEIFTNSDNAVSLTTPKLGGW